MFDTGSEEFAPVNLWHRLTATGAVSTIRHARRHWDMWLKVTLAATLIASPALYMAGRYAVLWAWGL